MSVTEYKYQKATHDQLEKCAKWCLNNFQLRDWKVIFDTGSVPPKRFIGDSDIMTCFGRGWINTNLLRAEFWINVDYVKQEGNNPYSTTIHEVFHALAIERAEDAPEQFIMIMEPMLYRLYCLEHRLKIAKVKVS